MTLGVPASDAAAARAAFNRFVDAKAIMDRTQTVPTVGTLWDEWLQERAADGFDNAQRKSLWNNLGPVFSNRNPETLTADDFRNYARQRFAQGRKPGTVHQELITLRACLNFAFNHRRLPYKVAVWAPQPGRPRDRVLTCAEIKALLEAAQNTPHLYLFIVLALNTGARHTAILELTWDRIEFIRGLINYTGDVVFNPMTKTFRKGRAVVPMNAMSRAILERAYVARTSHHVIEWRGRPIKSVEASFKRAVQLAGLDAREVTPHVIRHTVATWARQQTDDSLKVASLLGHRDVRVTEGRYFHPDPTAFLGETVNQLWDNQHTPDEAQTVQRTGKKALPAAPKKKRA